MLVTLMNTQVIIGWFEDRGLVLSEIISGQKASAYMDFRKKKLSFMTFQNTSSVNIFIKVLYQAEFLFNLTNELPQN